MAKLTSGERKSLPKSDKGKPSKPEEDKVEGKADRMFGGKDPKVERRKVKSC